MADLQSKLSDADITFQNNPDSHRYGIRGIPAIVVTDGNGDELGRINGLVTLYRSGRLGEGVTEQALAMRR